MAQLTKDKAALQAKINLQDNHIIVLQTELLKTELDAEKAQLNYDTTEKQVVNLRNQILKLAKPSGSNSQGKRKRAD